MIYPVFGCDSGEIHNCILTCVRWGNNNSSWSFSKHRQVVSHLGQVPPCLQQRSPVMEVVAAAVAAAAAAAMMTVNHEQWCPSSSQQLAIIPANMTQGHSQPNIYYKHPQILRLSMALLTLSITQSKENEDTQAWFLWKWPMALFNHFTAHSPELWIDWKAPWITHDVWNK